MADQTRRHGELPMPPELGPREPCRLVEPHYCMDGISVRHTPAGLELAMHGIVVELTVLEAHGLALDLTGRRH